MTALCSRASTCNQLYPPIYNCPIVFLSTPRNTYIHQVIWDEHQYLRAMRKRISVRSDTYSTTDTDDIKLEERDSNPSPVFYAWTLSGLIVYFNTVCHKLLLYLAYYRKNQDEIIMGITDWMYGSKSTKGEAEAEAEGEAEGEEMVPLIQDGARREGDGKVKRRRHQVGAKGRSSLVHAIETDKRRPWRWCRDGLLSGNGQSQWNTVLHELRTTGPSSLPFNCDLLIRRHSHPSHHSCRTWSA